MNDVLCLELFCGTKSFTKVLHKYNLFDTSTLDKNPIFKPDILMDIRSYEPVPCCYDIIWASPPCDNFSVMSAHHYWDKKTHNGKINYVPKNYKAINSLRLVEETIQIIAGQTPKYWFIENPRGMLQFLIDPIFESYSITDYEKKTVTYCKYGEKHMKPTNIWTNFKKWKSKPFCRRGDECHERVRSGDRKGVVGLPDNIHRGIVPEKLCQDIIDCILKDLGERL